MKKRLFAFNLILIITTPFLFMQTAQAQIPTVPPFGYQKVLPSGSILIRTNYNGREQLEQLLANSQVVIGYFEDATIPQPVFIGVISVNNKQQLESQGFTLEVLDTEPVSELYFTAFSYEPKRYTAFTGLFQFWPISDYDILIKGDFPSIHEILDAAGFHPRPIPGYIILPTLIPSPTPTPVGRPALLQSVTSLFLSGLILICFFALYLLSEKGNLRRKRYLLVVLFFAGCVFALAFFFSLLRSDQPKSSADFPIPKQTF